MLGKILVASHLHSGLEVSTYVGVLNEDNMLRVFSRKET